MRAFWLTSQLILPLALAQTPPAGPARMENLGQPMRVTCQCAVEDMRALGLACPFERPCPVYLEIGAVEAAAERIIVAGNLHTEAATLFSLLLATEDGGKTWYEPYERLRSVGFDQIEFLDFQYGWISGQTLGSVPRDPFLLLTRDGGRTWRARPIWNESRIGIIEAFHFDSRSHGLLWIDRMPAGDTENRYEEYESQTGGESWMLRQVSDRPLRRKAPAPSGSLRIHPDAAARAFRIERQSGERWAPLAGFLFAAGECKEPEITLPEPEPGPPPEAPAEPPLVRPR